MKKQVAACAAALCVVAVAATSASAAFVASTWNPGFPLQESGAVTFTNAGTPVSCSVAASVTSATSPWTGSCSNGASLSMSWLRMPGRDNGVELVRFQPFGGSAYGPWGAMQATGFYGDFVAGNASTPSRVVLSNDLVGYRIHGGTGEIRASGSIAVTTPSGGLVTIN